MSNQLNPSSAQLLALADNYARAVQAVMHLWRFLWRAAVEDPPLDPSDDNSNQRTLDVSAFSLPETFSPEFTSALIARLAHLKLIWPTAAGGHAFNAHRLHPIHFARQVLGYLGPGQDLQYWIRQDLRITTNCTLAPRTTRIFQLLATAVNTRIGQADQETFITSKEQQSLPRWHFTDDYLPCCMTSLAQEGISHDESRKLIQVFTEMCITVGYCLASSRLNCLTFKASHIDAEFLLSHLFGLPTGIRGFDELFGGGGILLTEEQPTATKQHKGRTTLIIGRFGTGKSLLSMQLAVEVARKGGLAYVIPLEQSADECLYTLESMKALPNDGSLVVATDEADVRRVLKSAKPGSGALVIQKTIKDSYADFLLALRKDGSSGRGYSLRLFVIDPINSVTRDANSVVSAIRAQTLAAIQEIEATGTNILLVAEEDTGAEDAQSERRDLTFEQNIADTVIRLSVRKEFEYTPRYFHISKSRMQREQRGSHPFSIVPGRGIHIFPSSAAVNARIRPRTVLRPDIPTRFGLPSLDEILGERALAVGDVLVLQGPGGSFKTALGLVFLMNPDRESKNPDQRSKKLARNLSRRPCSLLIAARDTEETIRHLLRSDHPIRAQRDYKRRAKEVRVCALPSGYVHPGNIFQTIEDHFLKARLQGYIIDRVMVDNVAHWEMSCPFIRTDLTFGDTLIAYLRRQGVTTLLTCADPARTDRSTLQQSIVDNADTCIQLDRLEYRGTQRVTLRILKTRGVRYRREGFELLADSSGMSVQPNFSLLRIDSKGDARPINIRLFLQAETQLQLDYNRKALEATKTVLSREIEIEHGDWSHMHRAMKLGTLSAIDELQVLQLDEFQLPSTEGKTGSSINLHHFPHSQWDLDAWAGILPRFERNASGKRTFCAVPYYADVSFLAYNAASHPIRKSAFNSWAALERECQLWEKDKPNDQVFFDFPKASEENYNCLFFEILLSQKKPSSSGLQMDFLQWLRNQQAVKSAIIYRSLGRRAYLAAGDPKESSLPQQMAQVNSAAVVWRHWYSSLNQMMSQLAPQDRDKIQVMPLPEGISIANEYYLGVPTYSASPSAGLEIIKVLTRREAELERVRLGVGLPIREEFYQQEIESKPAEASAYFSLKPTILRKMVETAFPRSRFANYSAFSSVLAYHLRRILEVDSNDDTSVARRIAMIFKDLESNIAFILS